MPFWAGLGLSRSLFAPLSCPPPQPVASSPTNKLPKTRAVFFISIFLFSFDEGKRKGAGRHMKCGQLQVSNCTLARNAYGVFGLVSELVVAPVGFIFVDFVVPVVSDPQPMVVVMMAATRTSNAISLFTVNPSFPEVAETMIPGHTVAWVIPCPNSPLNRALQEPSRDSSK